MPPQDEPEPSPEQLAELSAFADGTLDRARARELEARIAASAELSALYQRERRVVETLHQARAAGRAPPPLRARIEAQRASGRSHARRRAGYAAALAGALTAAALVLVLPAGTPGSPSVSQAAALAARGPSQAAPAPDPSNPETKLAQSLEHVYFPNWSRTFDWRAIGQRRDRLDGRPTVTVYYQWRGTRVAYTIVGGPALPQPAAKVTHLNGTDLRTLTPNGPAVIVTWRRAGHTCVLSGTGVPAGELQKLAAWKPPGITS